MKERWCSKYCLPLRFKDELGLCVVQCELVDVDILVLSFLVFIYFHFIWQRIRRCNRSRRGIFLLCVVRKQRPISDCCELWVLWKCARKEKPQPYEVIRGEKTFDNGAKHGHPAERIAHMNILGLI